jgi:hypothetical protein
MAEYQDLLKDTSQSYDNGDYFIVTIPGLIPGTIYPLEFRWKYKDGTFGEDWSAVKSITAPAESTPLPPSPAIVTYSQGIITVKWDGKNSVGGSYPSTLDKIEVYIKWATDADNLYISKGSIPATGGSLNIPVLPGDYNVKLRSVSKTGAFSGFNQVVNVTAKADAPGLPTVIVPAWSGTDFTVGFNSDPSAPANSYLSFYLIKLIATDGTAADFTLRPVAGSSQKFALSLEANRASFGVPQTSFSGSVSTVDIYGNQGTPVTFAAHVYVNNLPAPTINVAEAVEGYTVSYTTPTDKTFAGIEIQEVESTSATDPASGYETCFYGLSNPVSLTRSNQNKRWVRARFIANNGSAGQYGAAVSVTPKSVVVADLIPPTNPTGIGAVATVDTYDQTGFSLSSRISWTASTDTSTRGYRLRWSPDNPATVPNPNWEYGFTNATSFTASGLIPNVTYYYQVASVDQYNNTQTYSTTQTFTAADAAATAVNAAARLKSILAIGGATGDLFKFGTGIPDSINTSITTIPSNSPSPLGGYHGILLNKTGNKNNYWLTTGQLRVGTDTQFMYFNGTNLYLTGNINAASGSFTGNVNIASGGSLYSGAIVGGNLSGAGYILNSTGLTFNSAGTNGITTINGTTGKLTTASASIGNWDVTSSAISKTSTSGTLTLNSATAQITATSTSYTAGIATPNTNSPSDIVFWAGGARSTAANFYVQADGTVVMKAATITGPTITDINTSLAAKASTTALTTGLATKASTTDLTTGLATKLGAGGAAADVNSNTTTISGGKIRTGVIQSATYTAPGGSPNTTPFSQNGMSIVLDNQGSIISKQFVIDASGNAFFKGSLSAASGTFSGAISASTITATDGTNTLTINSNGSISNSSTNFSVSSSGILTAKSAIITGNITANAVAANTSISGALITGGSINVDGGSGAVGNDPDGNPTVIISTVTNAFSTVYQRNGIPSLGVNSIGFISVNSGGWQSSCYPYYDGGSDLGINQSSAQSSVTYSTYRWRNLRLTGSIMIGGNGSSDTPNPDIAGRPITRIFGDGRIFANTLGTTTRTPGSGVTLVQAADGYLRVYSSASSRNYKENIEYKNTEPIYDLIKNLSPVTFNYKPEFSDLPEQVHLGLIAEDVHEIQPNNDLVIYKNGLPDSVGYEKIPMYLVGAFKEMANKIDTLQARLDALEG